jgi:hypothetical protein
MKKVAAQQTKRCVLPLILSPIASSHRRGLIMSQESQNISIDQISRDRSRPLFLTHLSEFGGVNTFFLILIAFFLLFAHISMTTWLLRDTEKSWELLDNELESPLYCLSGDDLTLDRTPPKIRGPKPNFDDDGYYPCLPKRLDHAAPHKKDSPWPEALCLLATRLDLMDPGDERCA